LASWIEKRRPNRRQNEVSAEMECHKEQGRSRMLQINHKKRGEGHLSTGFCEWDGSESF
jgi:hypothetical protein